MAKQRIILTKFWTDTYIVDLKTKEKLLYLYLLTNPLTNICGIYETSIRQIAFDVRIGEEKVKKILNKFEEDGKIQFKDGYIAIKNFIKSQVDNPKVRAGISYELGTKPKSSVEFVDILDYEPTDRKFKGSKISKKLRDEIFERDGYECILCGTKDNLEIDHIIPVFQGGTNDKENLRVLCQSCNGKRNSGLRWEKDKNGWNIDSLPKKGNSLPNNINFNYKKGKFDGITTEYLKELHDNFPNIDCGLELIKMKDWLIDNPKKKRQGKRSFINNWLKRANDDVKELEGEGIPRLRQGEYKD